MSLKRPLKANEMLDLDQMDGIEDDGKTSFEYNIYGLNILNPS